MYSTQLLICVYVWIHSTSITLETFLPHFSSWNVLHNVSKIQFLLKVTLDRHLFFIPMPVSSYPVHSTAYNNVSNTVCIKVQWDLSTVTIVTVTKVIKYCDLKSYFKVCNRKIIFETTKVELQVHPSNQQQISFLSCGQTTKLTKTSLGEDWLDLKSLDDMQIISTLL